MPDDATIAAIVAGCLVFLLAAVVLDTLYPRPVPPRCAVCRRPIRDGFVTVGRGRLYCPDCSAEED